MHYVCAWYLKRPKVVWGSTDLSLFHLDWRSERMSLFLRFQRGWQQMWLQTRFWLRVWLISILGGYRGGLTPPGPKVREFKSITCIMLMKSVHHSPPPHFGVKCISLWKINMDGFRIQYSLNLPLDAVLCFCLLFLSHLCSFCLIIPVLMLPPWNIQVLLKLILDSRFDTSMGLQNTEGLQSYSR